MIKFNTFIKEAKAGNCPPGQYYCQRTLTCKPIPKGMKKNSDGFLVKEAKDPNEYDKEGDMAKTQLKTIMSAAQDLNDMLGDNDNLPEWVQNKITKATDYIDSVRDYMKAQDND